MPVRHAVLLALALTCAVAPGASAAPPGPFDNLCVLAGASDPSAEAPEGTLTGQLSGGPVMRNGTLTCTVQAGGATHADYDIASASATGTNGVTVLAPTLVSWVSPAHVPVYLCDRFHDGALTWYYDATTAGWTQSPSAACRLQVAASDDDPVLTPVRDALASGPYGVLCGLDAVAAPGGAMNGTVDAGPVHLGAPAALRSGTVRCTVRVGGTDVATVTGSGTEVVTIPPTAVSYGASPSAPVHLCTAVYVDGDPLHFDDLTDEWTTNPDAPCLAIATLTVPGPEGMRAHNDTHTHHGGRKNKNHSGGDGVTTQPYHPRGTIEITRSGTGIVNYAFTSFVPPVASWSCPAPTGTTITCTPPAPPAGYRNVCATVGVDVTSTAPGTVAGTSTCASAPPAAASSHGPTTTPSSGTGAPGGDFPWTCAAAPGDSVVWTVRCTVGP